ncbi:hypothetical protein ACFXPA_44135 [Amycolatopsis sp. NPDC059090]|uniref:hypothetical protein n=1 Tax=unclassified Amycolatopsis TaxID=2618356 RepID=UPI00366D652A
MSASRSEQAGADVVRDDYTRSLARKGHAMAWTLGRNARRKGHAYFWEGRCTRCGAEISVAADSISCPGARDARKTRCSGPGTAVLTDIENARAAERIAASGRAFAREHRR